LIFHFHSYVSYDYYDSLYSLWIFFIALGLRNIQMKINQKHGFILIFFLLGGFPLIFISLQASQNDPITLSTRLQIKEKPETTQIDSKESSNKLSPTPTGSNVIDEVNFEKGKNMLNQGYINNSNYHIFWFIQITDTQSIWYNWDGSPRDENAGGIKAINYFLNTTQNVIKPLLIINTGDLVDSAYQQFLLRNEGQRIGEWEYYNRTMVEGGMNSSYYYDIVGNHDIYRSPGYSHYMTYGMSGRAFGTDQFVLNFDFDWGNYNFYMLSIADDNGMEYPFSMGGYMSGAEMDWFESKLEKNAPTSNVSFAFGHQPPFEVLSTLSSKGKGFIGTMNEYGIDAYLCGHGHVNSYQEINGLAAVETDKFSNDGGAYRITVVDNDGISSNTFYGKEWPVGIITSPIDVDFAIGDYDMNSHVQNKKIRALAWDPDGVAKVEWQYDSKNNWVPLNFVQDSLYEADMNTNLNDGQEHSIEIKITNNKGQSIIESITYLSTILYHFGWNEAIFIIIAGFIGICVMVPLSIKKKIQKNQVKYAKPENSVDPEMKKPYLIKLLVFFLCPLTFGLMYMESFTAVFSFFLIGKNGFMYSDTILFFSIAIGLFSIHLVGLGLSPNRAKHEIRIISISLFWEVFLVVFYIIHFPTVAWLSPGYYILIAMDIRMRKQAKFNVKKYLKK
jgi:calcineurin-like phosphoesterase family protein